MSPQREHPRFTKVTIETQVVWNGQKVMVVQGMGVVLIFPFLFFQFSFVKPKKQRYQSTSSGRKYNEPTERLPVGYPIK